MTPRLLSIVRAGALAAACLTTTLAQALTAPSFAEFDRRAKAGEHLNVVFFGASLTWGANASDPLLTSYRAVVADRLREKYPEARFRFWDAAIGGTGSQLGVFRLDRDVLRRKPDLVFLDFSANDDIEDNDREKHSSYESLVRRLVVEAHVPVVQVIFPFLWNIQAGKLEKMKRRDAHLAIAEAYGTAVGDAIALGKERVAAGKTTLEALWPLDGVHPGDAGYTLFADAAWEAYLAAVKDERVCHAPAKMLYDDTYMTHERRRLSTIQPLPAGWHVAQPNVLSAYFDMMMSRWLEDEVVASTPPEKKKSIAGKKPAEAEKPADATEPSEKPGRLATKFRGGMVLLFGESTPKSVKYRVYIDGKLVEHRERPEGPLLDAFDAGQFGRRAGGNVHHVQVIATGLDRTVEHTIEIEPLFDGPDQELRLESLCTAGGPATPQETKTAAEPCECESDS
ncbi:MAG TPA: SGNH/GDSL hydrolase family protein [Pirellulales bacterium]|nr:SGNH/GDSL hydrolase family protein [Pirellulales bacterium]